MTKFQSFWNYAFERAAKTVAQSAVAVLTVEAINDLSTVNWVMVGSVAALAGLVSFLTSVINFDFATATPVANLPQDNLGN